MMLEGILKALTLAGSATPAVEGLINAVMPLFETNDQATLQEALADAQADNDEGHRRLQDKLAKAASEGR